MLPLATKEALLADSRRFETVEVPEWGCTVRIASLGALAWLELREGGGVDAEGKMKPSAMVQLVARSVVNEQGEQLLGEEDVRRLGQRGLGPILNLFNRCVALNSGAKEGDPGN